MMCVYLHRFVGIKTIIGGDRFKKTNYFFAYDLAVTLEVEQVTWQEDFRGKRI